MTPEEFQQKYGHLMEAFSDDEVEAFGVALNEVFIDILTNVDRATIVEFAAIHGISGDVFGDALTDLFGDREFMRSALEL